MNYRLDRSRGPIAVRARLTGPTGRVRLRMALDTGSSYTVINTAVLLAAGYNPAASEERVQVTTASGIEFAPLLTVKLIRALGIEKKNFDVLAHTLPPSASVDGLLGIDFFTNKVLTLDFRKERISID